MSGLAATLSLARPPTRRAMTHHAQSLLASHAVPGGIHHSVVVVRDLEASLRFYRDGIGLDLLQDRHVEGDWPDLFDAPSRRLRTVLLGDAAAPTTTLVSWNSTCLTVTSRQGRRAGTPLY